MSDSIASATDRPTAGAALPDRSSSACLHDLLRGHAARAPQSPALVSPGRAPLTYGQLWPQINRVIATLNACGLGRGDHIALALPDGPELAAAVVAVASGAVAVPFDPQTPAAALEQGFSDLNIRGVIVPADRAAPARAVAAAHGIAVLELTPLVEGPAGSFDLHGPQGIRRGPGGFAGPDDAALVLSTSGTTGEPKWAPYWQARLCEVLLTFRDAYALTPDDRCLDIMPLLYIHGVVNTLMVTLATGGSVAIPGGFAPQRFGALLDECQPTWFSGTPALLQAVLQRTSPHAPLATAARLRFIRCGGQPMSPQFIAAIEAGFGAPVLETYGMTETGILSTNPLPPGIRKAGSAGLPVGPELGVLDADGAPCPPGVSGEIAVRQAVMAYRSGERVVPAPAVPDGGWFRTGDEGHLDADGYIYLTGRLKEVINRGGEKVPPREVDNVLLAHPDVELAVAFGIPDPELGEAVAAAVVLRSSGQVTARELRRFAAERLAGFKVPRQIVIVPELPRSTNGKVRRGDVAGQLAAALLVDPERPIAAPRHGVEQRLAAIWEELLDIRPIGADDDFFELGGDSLKATVLADRIAAELGQTLPLESLYHAPTLRQLAALLQGAASPEAPSSVVLIQPQGTRPTLFLCIHPWPEARLGLREFFPHLPADQPVYGIQPDGRNRHGQPHTRIADFAADYVAAIRSVQPRGLYYLAGYSLAGIIAWEGAQQLAALGEQVAFLGLIDTPFPYLQESRWQRGWRLLTTLRRYGPRPFAAFAVEEGRALVTRLVTGRPDDDQRALSAASHAVFAAAYAARIRYLPRPLSGKVTLFAASEHPHLWDVANRLRQDLWRDVAAGGLDVVPVSGHHHSILNERHARPFAATLDAALRRAQARTLAVAPLAAQV